jgi:dTDP-4-dehydrorhamnose reductase
LQNQYPDLPIVAASRSQLARFPSKSVTSIALSASNFDELRSLEVGTVLNLARGEQDQDFQFHKELIAYCNQRGIRYIYASSGNAVDADVSRSHLETDPPSSQTEYGQFKARCENEMLKNCRHPVALRFPGMHGWAPNRMARTEDFLRRLQQGEIIRASHGVLQNRPFAGDLAKMIVRLVMDEKVRGVFHLGTSDFSDEVDFLQRLAVAFGYSPEQVVGGEWAPWNAVVVVDRWSQQFPQDSVPTEAQTIARVRQQPELQIYVQTSNARAH